MDECEVEFEPEDFVIGGKTFEITTISQLPIEILMNNHAKDIEISGQKLWCGSLAVIEYLLHHHDFVKDYNVIELGAGTGVAGMISEHICGSSLVILTDNDIKSIEHMKLDCQTNGIEKVSIQCLDWFNTNDIYNIGLQIAIDRHSEQLIKIIAGDVLYKKQLLTPFFATVRALFDVHAVGSQLLLCHVPRAGNDHTHVVEAAMLADLEVEEVSPGLWRKGCVLEYSCSEDYDRAKLYIISNRN